jgi:hypothetical protein
MGKPMQNAAKWHQKGRPKNIKNPKSAENKYAKNDEKKQCKNMRKHATTGVHPRAGAKSDPAQGEVRG